MKDFTATKNSLNFVFLRSFGFINWLRFIWDTFKIDWNYQPTEQKYPGGTICHDFCEKTHNLRLGSPTFNAELETAVKAMVEKYKL